MEEPIVSIYDLLLKRHRQQRKDEYQHQKELQQSRCSSRDRQSDMPAETKMPAEPKKPRQRSSRTKLNTEQKFKPGLRMATNVVTATHLTQKRSQLVLPTPTKKEVLNQLVEKMTGGTRKRPKKPADSAQVNTDLTETASETRVSSAKKTTTAIRRKPKAIKSSRGSASSKSRIRIALSPRNTNATVKTTAKREKGLKVKAGNEPKLQNRAKKPDAINKSLHSRKSKMSIKSPRMEAKSTSVDNAVRYRL